MFSRGSNPPRIDAMRCDAGAKSARNRFIADAERLLARESLKTMPAWVPPILDLIRVEAKGDGREIARAVSRLREPAREGRATLFELSYLNKIATPILARNGRADDALAILSDVTAANAPPPYDAVVMNPFLKRLIDDPRARDIAARSKARFDVLLEAIEEARAAGRFPRYLERPLQDLQVFRQSRRGDRCARRHRSLRRARDRHR